MSGFIEGKLVADDSVAESKLSEDLQQLLSGADSGSWQRVTLTQQMGNSEVLVMSQNAVTSAIYADPASRKRICIGSGTSPSYDGDILLGDNARSSGYNAAALVVGNPAGRIFENNISIGCGAFTNDDNAVTLGTDSISTFNGLAIGAKAWGNNDAALAIGYGSYAGEQGSASIGYQCKSGDGSLALGARASNNENGSCSVGADSFSYMGCDAVGANAYSAPGFEAVALGANSYARTDLSVALGYGSTIELEDLIDYDNNYVVSVGSPAGEYTRRVINVSPGKNQYDAVTVGQLTEDMEDFVMSVLQTIAEETGLELSSSEVEAIRQSAVKTALGSFQDAVPITDRVGGGQQTDRLIGKAPLGVMNGETVIPDPEHAEDEEPLITDEENPEEVNYSVEQEPGISHISVMSQKAVTSAILGDSDNLDSVCIGKDAEAYAHRAVAIGEKATASDDGLIAIGNDASASGENSVVIGNGSSVKYGSGSVVIGLGSSVEGGESIACGNNVHVKGEGTVALGTYSTHAANNSVFARSVVVYSEDAIGENAIKGLTSFGSTVICGSSPTSTYNRTHAPYSTSIGKNTKVESDYSIALGCYSEVKASDVDPDSEPLGVLSVGSDAYDYYRRRIIKVKPGVNPNDLATKGQLDAVMRAAAMALAGTLNEKLGIGMGEDELKNMAQMVMNQTNVNL